MSTGKGDVCSSWKRSVQQTALHHRQQTLWCLKNDQVSYFALRALQEHCGGTGTVPWVLSPKPSPAMVPPPCQEKKKKGNSCGKETGNHVPEPRSGRAFPLAMQPPHPLPTQAGRRAGALRWEGEAVTDPITVSHPEHPHPAGHGQRWEQSSC